MELFEKVTQKRRRKNKWMMVGISILTILVLGIGGKMLSSHFIKKQASKVVDFTELMDAVAYPNQTVYAWSANGGDYFHGGIKNLWARDVAGVPVQAVEQEVDFSWFTTNWPSTLTNSITTYYNGKLYTIGNGQKKGQFYNINAQATKDEVVATPTQELSYLSDMTHQLVEVYVTFDKPYSLKEIREKIPTKLKNNWYWIGTTTKSDSSTWVDSDLYGADESGLTARDRSVGVPDFLTNLKTLVAEDVEHIYNNVNPMDDVKAYLKQFSHLDMTKASDIEQLTFSGIVLTGKAEDFASLEGADWIYATSVGAMTPDFFYSSSTAQ